MSVCSGMRMTDNGRLAVGRRPLGGAEWAAGGAVDRGAGSEWCL